MNNLKVKKLLNEASQGCLNFFSNMLDLLITEKCYVLLFKGFVFLSICLFTSGQVVYSNALQYEKEAFALMFKVDAIEKTIVVAVEKAKVTAKEVKKVGDKEVTKKEYKSPKELNCSISYGKEAYTDCKNSQYLYDISSNLISAYEAWFKLLFQIMRLLFLFSLLGFIFGNSKESRVKKHQKPSITRYS